MKEIIVCSAIKFGHIIVQGVRHTDCFSIYQAISGEYPDVSFLMDNGLYTEGFMTNQGRFVDREEAYQIAVKNGQTEKSKNEILCSEDLY